MLRFWKTSSASSPAQSGEKGLSGTDLQNSKFAAETTNPGPAAGEQQAGSRVSDTEDADDVVRTINGDDEAKVADVLDHRHIPVTMPPDSSPLDPVEVPQSIVQQTTPTTMDEPSDSKVSAPEVSEQTTQPFPSSAPTSAESPETDAVHDKPHPPLPIPDVPPTRIRRISFRSFAFFYGRDKAPPTTHKTSVEEIERTLTEPEGSPSSPTTRLEHNIDSKPSTGAASKLTKMKQTNISKADKRATNYAYLLRSVIVGIPFSAPSFPSPSSHNPFKSRKKEAQQPPMKKLKSELLRPDEANRVIAQLRALPTPDTSKAVVHGTIKDKDGKVKVQDIELVPSGASPIHGVSLDCTDEQADVLHFSHLTAEPVVLTGEASKGHASGGEASFNMSSGGLPPNLASADITSVVPVLRDLKLVDLVTAQDFGFGQPMGSPGIFAGSVPSSGTLAEGLMQVGQQLLNLGFATSNAVLPSHAGIHPPKDRLSVLTYWWGYEVVIPPPSIKYLSNVKSISGALLNFLTAFSLFNNGVRELLPFIRYASQFIDFEWNAIKAQDKGKGVVCAATWVMPAALVPRAWDFEEPPANDGKSKGFVQFTVDGQSSPSVLAPLVPPFLPGTEILIQPVQPPSDRPDVPMIPTVTVTPPMGSRAVDDEE